MSCDDKKRLMYEAWVSDYASDLHRLAYRLSGQAAIAEDLVQETFYHAWRSMHTLREESKARAWLFQMLRFRYSHWVRDQTRRIRTSGMSDGFDNMHEAEGQSPLTSIANEEVMQAALNQLDDHYKLPLLMVYLEGRTCQETADALELPLGTVLSRLHRARKGLRQSLVRLDESFSDSSENKEEKDQATRFKLGG